MIRKALVTGGSGYIGSFLLRNLLADHIAVTVVIRTQTNTTALAQLPALRTVLHDGTTGRMLEIVSEERPDAVFHLAAVGGAEHATADLDRIIQANVSLGTQVLEGLRQSGGGIFVNTGTFWQHYDGNASYSPTSLYAATKQAFEDILTYYTQVAGVPAVTLKLFDVYGPHDIRRKLFSLLHGAQQSGVPLSLSPGEQLLDLVYIDDVIQAYRQAVRLLQENPAISGGAYAVSSGVRYTLREAVSVFEQVSGMPVPVMWGGRAYRLREIMVPWQGESLPGWSPRVSLAQGLRQLLEQQKDYQPSS